MIKKLLGTLLSVTVIASMTPVAFAERAETVYERTDTTVIGKGLTYEHKSKLTEAGWVDIHVLIADMKEPTLEVQVIRDEEAFGLRDGLSEMTSEVETSYIGGINGSFFHTGSSQSEIIGFEYSDEDVRFIMDSINLEENMSANLFLFRDGTSALDFITSDLSFQAGGTETFNVLGINTTADIGNPVVFNRHAFVDTAPMDALTNLYKVIVEEGVVTGFANPDETVEIPENGYVLTLHESYADKYLRVMDIGDTANLDMGWSLDTESLDTAFAGGGLILRDGAVVEEGLIVAKNSRHPRSAVALTEDGSQLIAMVVDGRRESIGATHAELASYLLEYGAYDAMHLDGGGSSTLIAREIGDFDTEVKNLPSDGYERPVVNGLGFVLNALPTSEFNLMLTADQTRVFVNNKIDLTLKAADLNYNPVPVDTRQIAWTMSGGYGILKDMTFVPKDPGTITLTAHYKGESKSMDIEVVDTLIDLEVVPKVIHFDDGIQTFTVYGTDEEGNRSIINNDLLTWEISAPVGTVHEGVFRGGGVPTDARIDVRYKGIQEVAYVVTGEIRESMLTMEGLEPELLVYPESVIGHVLMKEEADGPRLSLGYQFVPTDVSQAVYAVLDGTAVSREIDSIVVSLDRMPEDVLIKGHIKDSAGEQYTISFDQEKDGDLMGDVPSSVAYPISLTRLYAVTLATETEKVGEVTISAVHTLTKVKEKDLADVIDIPPVDAAYEAYPEDGFVISIFGATSGRNRLLDEVVLSKVYEAFNTSDFALYAGSSHVDEDRITNDHFIYDDRFAVVDLDQVRLISLGMSQGSMTKTDSSQWKKLDRSLSETIQDTIVFIGTERLVDNEDESFNKEGQIIHDTISSYAKKSGKKVFYINASGYGYNLSYLEGVRYIDLNGLWYKVGDNHQVDLYDSFQTVNINVIGDDVTYNVKDLYPKTSVGE